MSVSPAGSCRPGLACRDLARVRDFLSGQPATPLQSGRDKRPVRNSCLNGAPRLGAVRAVGEPAPESQRCDIVEHFGKARACLGQLKLAHTGSIDQPAAATGTTAEPVQPLSHVLRPIAAAHIAWLTAAPLPARGPPAIS